VVVVLIDHDAGALEATSLEALTMGRRLASELGRSLEAVVIGDPDGAVPEAIAAFAPARIHLVRHDGLHEYAPEAWATSLAQLASVIDPSVIAAPGSDRGNEVMAHLAAGLGLPMAANCTDVMPGGDGSPWLVTRVRWGGSLLEEARLHGAPKLLTIAPHAVAAEPSPGTPPPEIAEFVPTLTDDLLRVRVARRVERAGAGVSLTDARVVVGGGRGVGGADGFRRLERLAALLGGAVGCSRAVTSLGWRPHSDQVGQTGVRIAPDVYIACGISGAIQHMVGCKGAKRLIAINTDPEAPIMSRADYAVIGDVNAVVPALIEELEGTRA
jgi:electron transfer flavoprotein alpha subunit